jgi:hypothetical protein
MSKTEALLKLYRIASFYYSCTNDHREIVKKWVTKAKKDDQAIINFLNTQFGESHIKAIKEL